MPHVAADITPRAVVFAHRAGAALAPLTDRTCPALLPVGGKPVLAHTLDDVAAAGIRRVTVFVGAHAEAVEALAGDGRRWGLALDYALARGGEEEGALLDRLARRDGEELLLVQGTMLRTPCLREVLASARERPGSLEFAAGGRALGIRLLRAGAGAGAPSPVEMAARVAELDSLSGFHCASLEVAAGAFPGLLLPGREQAVGLVVGHGSKVAARCVRSGRARIGARTRIAPTAILDGPVAVEDGCLVDAGARLANAVVLPGSYVGRLLDVRNAIVSGADLVRVDTGAVLRLEDPELLANMRDGSPAPALERIAGRAAGMLLLLLSLPLWPLALLSALATNRGAPLRRLPMRGNDRATGRPQAQPFDALEWRIAVPVLRALPRLLAVCCGRLCLVGVSPHTDHAAGAGQPAWAAARDRAAVGLLGPVQVELAPDAPPEERLLAESWFVRRGGWRRDLRYLWLGLRALVAARAWRGLGPGAAQPDTHPQVAA